MRRVTTTKLVSLSALLSLAACGATAAGTGRTAATAEERSPEPASVEDAGVPGPSPAPPMEPSAPARPTEASAPAPRAVTVGASGDAIFHLKVIRSAREYADQGGFDHVLGGLRDVIGQDEVAFLNLETPLSARVPAVTGEPPVLGAPPEVAAALASAGLDVVSVANNHSYDQTAGGVADTLAALHAAGVLAVGAAPDPALAPGPVVVERGSVRVAFVAFTERINRGPVANGPYTHVARYDDEAARAALARAREVADVVVLSIHWSHDFVTTPRLAQRARARLLVDAGADVVLGHGPHVLQEVERLESPRGEAVVAYSLGNLVSNQALRYWTGRRIPASLHPAVVLPTLRDGAWLRVRITIEDGRIEVANLEAVPLFTVNNFLDVARHRAERLDVHVSPLRALDEATRNERRPEIAAALGDAVTLLP